ncbi:MAG: TspO/MBR family protein [Candidatus Paceibacterota bacterium]
MIIIVFVRLYMNMMTNSYNWYSTLIKPSWAPPSWLFGPVWSVLYTIIAISFGTVFYKVFTRELSVIFALPYILNLVFNFSFTYFQFGLKNNILASVDIILVLATLIWIILQKLPMAGSTDINWVRYVNIPYLAWVSFATVLQLTITFLN